MPVWAKKTIFLVVVIVLGVFLDQATKLVIQCWLVPHQTVSVIPGFFNLTHVYNPGGAFGIFSGFSPLFRKIFFLAAGIFAAAFILYLYSKTPWQKKWVLASFGMIIAGAIGNVIDRLRYGMVVDFLDVYIGKYHWPAFNVADSMICVGIGIIMIYIIRQKEDV